MATLSTRKSYRRRLLEAIGNQSPEELGRLAIDMMEGIDRTYEEAGIDDSVAEGDEFEYNRVPTTPADTANSDMVTRSEYERLAEEYRRRFSGIDSERERPAPREDIPLSQPAADDITIGVNPDSGRVEASVGNGFEDIVNEEDIFDMD